MYCIKCGTLHDDKATFCTKCGLSLKKASEFIALDEKAKEEEKKKKPIWKKWWFWVLVIIVAFSVFSDKKKDDNMPGIVEKRYTIELPEVQPKVTEFAQDYSANNNLPANTEPQIIIMDVDYVDMWENYSDREYKGNFIKITGKLQKQTILNEPQEAFCFMEDIDGFIFFGLEENDFNEFSENDYATIIGKVVRKEKNLEQDTAYIEMEQSTINKATEVEIAAIGQYVKEKKAAEEAAAKELEEKSKAEAEKKAAEEAAAKEREEKAKAAIAEYKKNAKTISYNDLIRNPDDFKGEIIKVTIKVSQVMGGGDGFINSLYEKGYHGKANGNEWYVQYDLPEGATRIIEGDTVTFYGEFSGLKKVKRVLGNTDLVPEVKAKYYDMK